MNTKEAANASNQVCRNILYVGIWLWPKADKGLIDNTLLFIVGDDRLGKAYANDAENIMKTIDKN